MVERIVLKRRKNSEELVLDMVSTPNYILKSVDWGSIKGKHHSYKYVNQVGETITNTSLGTRTIKIEGWIVANTANDMTALKRRLNSFVNPQEVIDLLYSDYSIGFAPDDTVKYSINTSENNEFFCKFQIDGTAPNPLFLDNFESSLPFVTTVPSFHFPLVMSKSSPAKGVIFGKRTSGLTADVINKGSIPVGMKIVFKANGEIVNPSLTNINTQESFAINKTLVADEEIVINTNIGEKSIKGRIGNAEYSNYFMYKDIDSSWLQLEVGNNTFTYAAEKGLNNLDVFVYFYNRYLEVQECY